MWCVAYGSSLGDLFLRGAAHGQLLGFLPGVLFDYLVGISRRWLASSVYLLGADL